MYSCIISNFFFFFFFSVTLSVNIKWVGWLCSYDRSVLLKCIKKKNKMSEKKKKEFKDNNIVNQNDV